MTEGGVICAGSIVADYVVVVDQWPSESSLSNIYRQTKGGGGGPFNIVKDLRAMDPSLSLSIIGLLGNDDNGHWLKEDCKNSNVNVSQLHITDDDTPTSYTYVITVESTGRRTFFNQRGTNSLLSEKHFDFSSLLKNNDSNLFYLGYLTLLDVLDLIVDNETIAGRVLKTAKQFGLQTVTDFVSVNNPQYSQIALLTLPYVDHLIINEIELGLILNKSFQHVTVSEIEEAAKELIENYGVQCTVTIHFERGAVCVSRDKDLNTECFYQGSFSLPQGYIKSAVGAGDAFAAGIIYGIYKRWSIEDRLRCGICVATMCLNDLTTYAGVGTIDECLQLQQRFYFQKLTRSSYVHEIEN